MERYHISSLFLNILQFLFTNYGQKKWGKKEEKEKKI